VSVEAPDRMEQGRTAALESAPVLAGSHQRVVSGRRLLQVVAGTLVSALALWLTVRGKDLGAVWSALRSIQYGFLLPYVALGLAIHLARTLRWGILLEPVAKVPFSRLNAASAVGFMALLVLPLRLGELARPYLVADRPRLRVSAALSSVVVERIVDSMFVALLLVVALLGVPGQTPALHLLRAVGLVVFAAFTALLVFLVVARWRRDGAVSFLSRLVGVFSGRLATRSSAMLHAFLDGFRIATNPGKGALFMLWTAAYWAMSALQIALLARAFGIVLSPVGACTVLGAVVVGVMIPAGPGSVGTFQAAVLVGLGLFLPRAVLDTRGVAFAHLFWAAQFAIQTAVGLVFLFSRHIRFERILHAPEEVAETLEEEMVSR
jgi:uncharacterized protein (TIRG00374 family)